MAKRKITVQELKQAQSNLCDELILDADAIATVLRAYQMKMDSFHSYSLSNLILAESQLREYDMHVELLAGYKKFKEEGIQVQKGSKAIYVLAPVKIKNKRYDPEDEDCTEPEYIITYRKVPVFDIQMTDAKDMLDDKITGDSIKFADLVANSPVPVVMVNGVLTGGWTDGEKLYISRQSSENHRIATYFHEYGHYILHFGENRDEIPQDLRELDAEVISYILTTLAGYTNERSKVYISCWNGSADKIKGRGKLLIDTAMKIAEAVKLEELLSN